MLPGDRRLVAAAAQNLRLFASGVEVSGAPVDGSMLPALSIGATGPKVEALQLLLRQTGADIVVDGEFFGQTDGVVRGFQGMVDSMRTASLARKPGKPSS